MVEAFTMSTRCTDPETLFRDSGNPLLKGTAGMQIRDVDALMMGTAGMHT